MEKTKDYKFPFEKLKVWQIARELSINIYRATSQFPNEEKFGLTNQVRRAAVSVMSNLAEGSGRRSRKDHAHFSQLAYGSLLETACQLQLARDLEFISENIFMRLAQEMRSLSALINALHRSQLDRSEE